MFVKLVRHTMPGRPEWPIIQENVPIGTVYEVMGYQRESVLYNTELNEFVLVPTYFLMGNKDTGWMPACCFEVISNEKQSC